MRVGWTFDDFKSGGCKGGTLMAFVGSYIVKQLSRADHSVLLEITASCMGAHSRADPVVPDLPSFQRFHDGNNLYGRWALAPTALRQSLHAHTS